MKLSDRIRKTPIPTLKDIQEIPGKARTAALNQELSTITVRFFDRYCKKFRIFKGTIEFKTDIPIVYWNSPIKLGGILYDDCIYYDDENKPWVDFVQDYPFGLAYLCELQKLLGIEYLNDIANEKLDKDQADHNFNRTNSAYMIPMNLNAIPREVIRIDIEQSLLSKTEAYIMKKIQVTSWLVAQWGNIPMYERVGKKDNTGIFFGIILGVLPGIIFGIFAGISWLR